jgi:hypothetical protein
MLELMVVTLVLLELVVTLEVTRVLVHLSLLEVVSLCVEEVPWEVPRWRPQRKVSMWRLLDSS